MKLILILLMMPFMVFSQPTNDLCSGSITITDFGCWDGDNTGAGDDVSSCSGCQTPNCGRWDEVWFDITPTTTTLTYSLTGSAFSEMSIVLYAVPGSGCPGASDDLQSDCGSSPIDGSFTGLSIGTTYYIAVAGVDNEEGVFNICFGTSLPIELTEFYGYNENEYNKIQWTTLSETNNATFLLERSIDGKSWEVIEEMSGAGNSTQEINYEIKDYKYQNTLNYYRLTQVDYDGKYEKSKIISINNREESKKIIKIINFMGQEVGETYEGLRIIIYNDGSKIKKIGK